MINKVADDNDVAELSALLQCVPTETIDFAFAYGSGAVAQRTNRADNMVDFIIATNSAENFHRSNLRTNAAHYSIVRHFGVAAIARIQCNYAARIYYNTRVRTGNRMIKYGVIETGHLIGDLLDWQSIYAAGRLHKPTVIVHPTNDRQLQAALRVNLQNAMRVALLLLPESFDVDQFYMRIASLSYDGDFRMRVGEDRDKVATIVDAAKHRFGDMYLPLLTDDAEHVMMNDNGRIYQDGSPIAVYHHLNLLPRTVLVHIHEAANRRQKRNRDLEEVVFSLAHRHDYASIVAEAIRTIVARSSIRQTIKNAITAGAYNSVVYAMRKVGRMVRSRLR